MPEGFPTVYIIIIISSSIITIITISLYMRGERNGVREIEKVRSDGIRRGVW